MAEKAKMVQSRTDDITQPLRITVLAGGPSRERSVSQASGQAVADALKSAGYEVILADITPDNLSALDLPADVVFPVLHGVFGEDGQVQELLEQRGLTYCGSGPAACRLSMNKYDTKLKMLEAGIPTPAFDIARTVDDIPTARACWTLPVVVKPVEEGSSFGVTIVKEGADLGEVLKRTLQQFGPSLVEQFIDGRELTVGILAGKALPIIEICPTQPFYDYEAKYYANDTKYIFLKDLLEPVYRKIQDLSVLAAAELGLRDFCRVDWRLDRNQNPFLLEVNAIPGFTGHSLLPKAAAEAGLDMVKLCKTIVELALARKQAPAGVAVK